MSEHENGCEGIRLTRRQMESLLAAYRQEAPEGDVVVSKDAGGKLRVSVEETITRLRPLALTGRHEREEER